MFLLSIQMNSIIKTCELIQSKYLCDAKDELGKINNVAQLRCVREKVGKENWRSEEIFN